MNEKIEVIYPSEVEIKQQVDFIVTNSPLKRQAIHSSIHEYGRSLEMVQLYIMLESRFKLTFLRLDVRAVFQQYLEVIVVGIMVIFGLLLPNTS